MVNRIAFDKKDQDQIKAINLSRFSSAIIEDEQRAYFLEREGIEHYRLLAWLSIRHDHTHISDIGTYKGLSALALSYNGGSYITSYDVQNSLALYKGSWPHNVEFVLYNRLFSVNILKSTLIFLDITHNGTDEQQIIDFLIKNNWTGLLIMDDIHHFPDLNKVWNKIELPKQDITYLGHWSGTGIVYFDGK